MVDVLHKHDAARVLQSCFKQGDAEQRSQLIAEIKGKPQRAAACHVFTTDCCPFLNLEKALGFTDAPVCVAPSCRGDQSPGPKPLRTLFVALNPAAWQH